MKRTFKSLLAAAALAFIGLGSLLAASPAEAGTWIGPISEGSHNNCYGFSGSTWPESPNATRYIYCGTTPPNSNSNLQNSLDAFYSMPGSFAKGVLSTGSYKVVYTESFDDYCKVNNFNPCSAHYTSAVGLFGITGWNSNFTQQLTFLLQEIPSGVNGGYIQNPIMAHTTLHEAGHAYDALQGSGSGANDELSQKLFLGTPSWNTVTFLGELGTDKAWWGWNRPGFWNSYAANTQYERYFHDSKSFNFREMFAEIFAMGASGSKWNPAASPFTPSYYSVPSTLDPEAIRNTQDIQNGLICAEVYVWTHMNNGTVSSYDYGLYGLGNRCFPSNDLNHHIGG